MSNLKKVLALVLVLALSLTMFAGAIETVLPYDDVDELTAEQLDSLKLLYALGVIKGDDENSVNPTDTLTRGELCAILYRLYTGDAEEKYVSTYSTDCPYFDDVEDGKWYVPYVNWAYIKGVVAGYGNGNFGPMDNVDGVQAATMLARLVGYEIGSENWELVARKHAIELGLDDGVSSKDLFGTDLSRGDMIVMVANVLDCYEVGTKVTLAEKIFDLEIIRGAILLGADKLGSTDYSVFAFKDEISGNVKYFITDLLSIEEKPTVDEIGQKYTLYVAKTTEVNGYKVLYAAYEEAEGAYYKTVTGTVDDGKLNVKEDSKDDYLLKLLDKNVIAYINGEVVANNKADAFAAFKASYGLKNSAAYKLIDNDGDGLYEYIFVERLTLANMNTTEIVANVVAYNNITGAYTLSDGKEYVPGQYWGYDADKKEITGVVNAVDAIVAAIGTGTFTASSVQYKFTIENGKYLMKAEICDETYFAGNYVLSMGTVGTSTYKGMQYVKFLTEDNTSLYAYVSKIDHIDARVYANRLDNNNHNYFENLYDLFYINAYGDDTVEIFTANYANSNYVNDFVDGNNTGVATFKGLSSFDAALDENARYTKINLAQTADGGWIPELAFDGSKVYAISEDGVNFKQTLYSASTYKGAFQAIAAKVTGEGALATALAEAKEQLETAKGELATANNTLAEKQDAYDKAAAAVATAEKNINDAKAAGTYYDPADTTTKTELGKKLDDELTAAQAALATPETELGEAKNTVDEKKLAVTAAETAVEEAEDAIAGASNIYYRSSPDVPGVKVEISFDISYETDELQIYKAYGTWYVQNYGDQENATVVTYFTVDGKTSKVKYDESDGLYKELILDNEGKEVFGRVFGTGVMTAAQVKAHIDEYLTNYDPIDDEDFIYDEGHSLNTSKGVVFAYGRYRYNGDGADYLWRAYNFDEFNVRDFGEGGPNDDWAPFVKDQMIYTVSNGQYYVKAAKVTVKQGDTDYLPWGWMVENSKIFVYGKELGSITTSGITVQSILPNGAFESIFVPFGYNFQYGDVIYAVSNEDGSYVSYEKVADIYEILKGVNVKLLADAKSSFKSYAADGTVTMRGKLGREYTEKIDLAKTFFVVEGKNIDGTTINEFISSAAFEKYLKDNNVPFVVYTDANGYYYATTIIA